MEVAFLGVETIPGFSLESTIFPGRGRAGLTSEGGESGGLPRAAEGLEGFLGEAVVTSYPETVARAWDICLLAISVVVEYDIMDCRHLWPVTAIMSFT